MTNCEEELRLAKERIKMLEENEIDFSLRLWLALEDILEKDKGFYHPDNLELSVFDNDFEVNRTIAISPKDLICVITDKNQDVKGNNRRKKQLFVKDVSVGSDNKVRTYTLNNNALNFKKLCNQLDPLSHFLIVVSKNSIVNVKFYDQIQNYELKVNLTDELPEAVKTIAVSDSKIHRENFTKIKEAYNYRVLLQKKVIGYKYSIGIDG
ncbi:MAG: hypothetical protein J0L54_03785 [Chitinophagales bacterium]|nr:hypothetical protein [Chitinophagales bacterium]